MQEEVVDTTGPSSPRMIDVVAAELNELQSDSLKFRTAIDEAKTKAKKDYFKKKLKKNNKRMMNMLVAFEKLRGRSISTVPDAENLPEPEAPELVPED